MISRLKLFFAILVVPLSAHSAGSFYGYLTTTDGNLARDTYGGCIKTGYWEERGAQPICNDELVRVHRYVAADKNWDLSPRLPEFVSDFFERYGKPTDYKPSDSKLAPLLPASEASSDCVIRPGLEVDIGKIEATALCEYSVAIAMLTGVIKSSSTGNDAIYLLEEAASKNYGPAINLIGYLNFYGFFAPQDSFSSGWNFSKAEEAGSYEGGINAARLKAYGQTGGALPSMNHKQDMNIFIIPDVPSTSQLSEPNRKKSEKDGSGSDRFDAADGIKSAAGSTSGGAGTGNDSSGEDSSLSNPNEGIRVKMY